MSWRSLSKTTILDLTATAIPEDEPLRIMILEMLDEVIPNDALAQYLSEMSDRRVQRVLRLYQAYEGIQGMVRLGDAIDWFRKNARRIIEAYELRMKAIAALLEVFGDVEPDQMIEIPGSLIVDIRCNTTLPKLEEDAPLSGETA